MRKNEKKTTKKIEKAEKIEIDVQKIQPPKQRQIISCINYIEEFLKIRDKRSRLTPFILNEPQRRLYNVIKEQRKEKKPVRILVLKARQMGFSTLTAGMFYYFTAMHSNRRTVVVTQSPDTSDSIFNIYKTFYSECPPEIRPEVKNSNAKEVRFDSTSLDRKGLKSSIRVYSSDTDGLGRGGTISYLHISEYAFWSDKGVDNLQGLLQSVPDDPDTIVIIESTANGYNDFQKLWTQAKNKEIAFTPIFFPWYELKSYQAPIKDLDTFKRSLSEEEKKLKYRYKLTYEQLQWRRNCIANNCKGSEEIFKQEYPTTPDEAFLVTGSPFFNTTKLRHQLDNLNLLSIDEYQQDQGQFEFTETNGLISSFNWLGDNEDGVITIYDRVKPNTPYVIGADTAGQGSDYFVAYVIDNTNGETVARFRGRVEEKEFATQLYCLGAYYNWALLAIEVNFSSYPQNELQRLGYENYGNFYMREVFNNYNKQVEKRFGFRTDSVSRPAILGNLQTIASERPDVLRDRDLLHEMLVFARDKTGKPQAPIGEHDDCVMAYAIAQQARGQQSTISKNTSIQKMLDDYSDDLTDEKYRKDLSGGIW